MESHFSDYVLERQESELEEYSTELEIIYQENDTWEGQSQELQILGRNALRRTILLKIYDEEEQLLWSPSPDEAEEANVRVHNHLLDMENAMENTESDRSQTQIPLYNNGSEQIGTVEIQFGGPFAYTQHEALFISDMRSILIWVAFISLLISLFFAIIVAKKLSAPIVAINNFTGDIKKGHYSRLSLDESGVGEIDDLKNSVNELSQQLQLQQVIRNRLSSDIAHEIRTPLTTLKGNIEAMIDGVWEVSEERLYRCYEEINRITRLISEIDRINEIESQESLLQKSSFDLKELSEQIVDNFQALLMDSKLDCSIRGDSVIVFADQDKMHQVITNLLFNAIKFTPTGGKIDIYVSQSKDIISFQIVDNGKGIPPDELSQIFERFYMTEPSRNSQFGGQGIGLSIVKSIVHAHLGTISVDSIYGKGTSFTIELPKTE